MEVVRTALLVNPGFIDTRVGAEFAAFEPECNLPLGRLDRIRTVDTVPANIDAVLPTNGRRVRVQRVGRPNHLASRSDDPLALKDQGQDLGSVERAST